MKDPNWSIRVHKRVYKPVGAFAASLELGAAKLGLSEGGGGEGERGCGARDEGRHGAGRAFEGASDGRGRGRRR